MGILMETRAFADMVEATPPRWPQDAFLSRARSMTSVPPPPNGSSRLPSSLPFFSRG